VNPWNTGHWSGGSSSGSGSAVAAGLVPFAIGSETWGSILSPAGYCGVAGLRPTYGRVSRHGAMVLSWTLDKLGPLALTADDCGLVLEALAGDDPADPASAPGRFRYDAGADTGATVGSRRRFRFGVASQALAGCDDAVRQSFEHSLEVLREFGSVEDVRLPDLPYEAAARTILYAEASSAFEDLIESGAIAGLTAPEDRYTPYARDAILAKDYLRALRLAGVMAREVDRLMSGFDALVAPGRPTLAPRLDQEFRSAIGGTVNDVLGAVGNMAGLPAVVVPNGFGPGDLPTSLQFLGRAFEENTILAAARTYQAATGWHLRHPAA
jgi:aspartyl-tRNA(Asn)/glutamyl-tRNA(Gln) amidotransferase subunit A